MNDASLTALAERFAGEPVELELVRGGGNNRLYRARGVRRSFALKHYPGDPDERRERLGREFGGLRFLWESGIRSVPEPLACDDAAGVALYRWIDGTAVTQPGQPDVDALAVFACALHERRFAPGAGGLSPAREAVTSAAELDRQLGARLARLAEPAATHAGLQRVLDEIADAARRHRRAQPPHPPRGVAALTLSPSDFGFHNALRTPSGLVFVDFEYFGWDDPVKLVADVLWHPGMALARPLRQKFYRSVADVYGVDHDFPRRFEREAPLYGLRWALIALNEFLPDVWERRVFAGHDAEREAVLPAQLLKATALLDRVRMHDALI